MRIKRVLLDKILNSGGKEAIEAKVILDNGTYALASAPSAIMPGKREVIVSDYNKLDNMTINNFLYDIYKIKNINQQKLDEYLEKNIEKVGSDITLSISLAFARASSISKKISLVKYIEKLNKETSTESIPKPLVAIFSDGVHNAKQADRFQQIMISVNSNNFEKSVNTILNIYNEVEKVIREKDNYVELGASSGFITKNMTTDEQLKLLTDIIKKMNFDEFVTIALDVAAEHLKVNDKYKFENNLYTSEEFKKIIQRYINKYNITFVEDPFDTEDKKNWIEFNKENKNIIIVGDDLFATQSQFINNKEASGIIIKMNQVGTLYKTIETVKNARLNNFKLCVSHRSLETEDTFICDLALAINSEYIKIGGPRRGDRISKYNRLLKLTKKNKM